MAESSGAKGTVSRLKQVTLQDFRGFKGRHELDVDADLVLISGPNGHGKSSLLEGLTLLLTGWHSQTDPIDLISRDPAPEAKVGQPPAKGTPRDGFVLSAEAEMVSGPAVGAQPDGNGAVSGTLFLEMTKEQAESASSSTGAAATSAGQANAKPANPVPMPSGIDTPRWYKEKEDDRELSARICAFFQDRIDLLFDQAAKGMTLRDVFEPLSKAVKDVDAKIGKQGDEPNTLFYDLDRERESGIYSDDWTKKPVEALNADLDQAWGALVGPLRRLADILGAEWPKTAPPIPDHLADDTQLDEFAAKLIAALGGRFGGSSRADRRDGFRTTLRNTLEAQIRQARRAATEATERTRELKRKLGEVETEITRIKKSFPNLDADIRRFSPAPSDSPDLPNALAVFQALESYTEAWAKPAAEEESPDPMASIAKAFAQVDWEEAGKQARRLDQWLGDRLQARETRVDLEKQAADLEREIERSLRSARLDDLLQLESPLKNALETVVEAWAARHAYTDHNENAPGRAEARLSLRSAHEALVTVADILTRLTAPSPALMEGLRKGADDVLWRFSLVEGVLPLHLVADDEGDSVAGSDSRRYAIRTKDGRSLEHLSTGQRAQVGVSLMVSQNIAATRQVSHRVILLDDVTTAYDLSNLTREAILWRQFAYGAEDGSDMKRQIFISSHHEDMTNHLLDLLVPPPGKTMRLIQFKGWSNDGGPVLDQFTVESSESVNRNELAQAFGAF